MKSEIFLDPDRLILLTKQNTASVISRWREGFSERDGWEGGSRSSGQKGFYQKEKDRDFCLHRVSSGGFEIEKTDYKEIERNVLRCPDRKAAAAMERKIEETKERGDTLGGIVEILVRGCPAGLGEPVFDKLEADLAKALMSIGAVRGVEIGAGF